MKSDEPSTTFTAMERAAEPLWRRGQVRYTMTMADDQRLTSVNRAPLKPEPARFSVEEFELLIESGVAEKLGRIELRGGEIYRMNPTYAPHARMRFKLARLLQDAAARLERDFEVLDEVTTKFGDFLPLPDVVLFSGTVLTGAIPAQSIRLIVEVADTTVADDLGPKRDLYAAAGLAEYWVVDMTAGVILQHATPVDGVYTQSRTVARGSTVESLTLTGLRVETAALPWDVA